MYEQANESTKTKSKKENLEAYKCKQLVEEKTRAEN